MPPSVARKTHLPFQIAGADGEERLGGGRRQRDDAMRECGGRAGSRPGHGEQRRNDGGNQEMTHDSSFHEGIDMEGDRQVF